MAYIRANMKDRSTARVRTIKGDLENFLVEMGLHQGSILYPFLFALVIDELTWSIEKEVPCYMLFVDDILFINKKLATQTISKREL